MADRPTTNSYGSGGNADALASLRNVNSQFESTFAGLDSAAAPLRGAVAPLAPLGKQIVALASAVILFIGTFLPAASFSISFLGSSISDHVSLWSWHWWAAFFITIAAIIGAGAALLRMYASLWVATIVALVFVVLGFITTLGQTGWGPSWGWIFLLIGLLGLIAATVMPDDGRSLI